MTELTFLSIDDVSSLPERPGVYVWYVIPQIGRKDYEQQQGPLGVDTGNQSLRRLLYDFSVKLRPRDLKTSSQTSFRDMWRGSLSADLYDSSIAKLLADEFDRDSFHYPGAAVDKTMRSASCRRALVENIRAVAPFFWTPVYIGMSSNLRVRVTQHTKAIRQLYDSVYEQAIDDERKSKLANFIERTEELLCKLQASEMNADTSEDREDLGKREKEDLDTHFAARYVGAGLRPSQAIIAYKSTEGETIEESIAIAQTLEWLLNTWNRPLFGVR